MYKSFQLAAAEACIAPALDREVDDGSACCWQIGCQRLASGFVAACDECNGKLVQARIVRDDHQPLRIQDGGVANNM
jgi:hypothetical protein